MKPQIPLATAVVLCLLGISNAQGSQSLPVNGGAITCANFRTIAAATLIATINCQSQNDAEDMPANGCMMLGDEDAPSEWQNTLVADKLIGSDRRLTIVRSSRLGENRTHDILRVHVCRHGHVKLVYAATNEQHILLDEADQTKLIYSVNKISRDRLPIWRQDDPSRKPIAYYRFHGVERSYLTWISSTGEYRLDSVATVGQQIRELP